MEYLKNLKKEYLIAASIIVIILVLITLSLKSERETIVFDITDTLDTTEQITYYYVDIKGEVNNPGVYKVSSDYRLFQVVNLAGGLTSDADTLAINLSQKIRDELAIYIPSVSDGFESVVVVDVDEGLININTASLEILDTLQGIGPSTAQAIIDYRNENIFNTIDDIKNVPGIGDATFNEIKNSITT